MKRALALYYHLAVTVALMEAPACMRLKLYAVAVFPLLDLGRLFSLDFDARLSNDNWLKIKKNEPYLNSV